MNAEGDGRFARYRIDPEAGVEAMPDDELESASPNYLQDDIHERLERGPVGFRLLARLAEEGDPLDDPTAAWPDERETVELGRIALTGPDTTRETGDDVLVFDPTRMTDGIELSDDPILAVRSWAYSASVERRNRPQMSTSNESKLNVAAPNVRFCEGTNDAGRDVAPLREARMVAISALAPRFGNSLDRVTPSAALAASTLAAASRKS